MRCRRRPRLALLLGALWLCAAPAIALPSLVGTPTGEAPAGEVPAGAAAIPVDQLLGEDRDALDARIEQALSRQYQRVPGLEQVEVAATAGVLTLRGEVAATEDRLLAERLARGIAEVVDVRNRLEVSTDVATRLSPAWQSSIERIQRLLSATPLLLLAIVIVLVFGWIGRWLSRRERLFRRVRRNPFLAGVLRQAVAAAWLVVGILIALDLLGATALVGAVLGTAGLIGLVLGFAFRDLAENYIASVLLSLRQPFAPDDHVVIDGHEGRVVGLNSRATTLMTLQGNHLRLPNALVFKSVMLNYTRNPLRQFDFTVGVGGDQDLERAQQLGLATLRAMHGVLDEPPPLAAITEIGDFSVAVRFFAWINQREVNWLKARSEAIRLVKSALDEAGIDMPEPTYRVQLHEAGAGDAPAAAARPPAAGPQADVSATDELRGQIDEERAHQDRDLLDPHAERE